MEDTGRMRRILNILCRRASVIRIIYPRLKLKKWLGIEGLAEYDSYIVRWHEYVKQLQAALPGLSEDNVKILNTFNLRVFYMTTYAGCADDKAFYAEFDRRLAMAKEKLGLM